MATDRINLEPFALFANFIAREKEKHVGQDLAGNIACYVPLCALQTYWNNRRITQVLSAVQPHLQANVHSIKTRYLRVFSALVCASNSAVCNLQRQFISHDLNDTKLPLRERPVEWGDTPFHRDLFQQIRGSQWAFFPLCFHEHQLQDRELPKEYILPIDPPIEITHGDAARIEKFTLHDSCNELVPKNAEGVPIQRTFVMKTYHNDKDESVYETEKNALMMLSNVPSTNVVKFYGCFRQHGSYSLILEYVDGGNLGDYFDNIAPPSTAEEVMQFWKSLFQVFYGLDRIHRLMLFDEDTLIKGIHEDIKPENVLLMKGNSGSPYDFTPKIADFGLFSRVRSKRKGKSSSSESIGFDNIGNQRFSSPECSHHVHRKGANMITTKADIFSIGAVISHSSVWLHGGPDAQVQYLKQRRAEHKKNPRFANGDYEGCFHDGIAPLPIIARKHEHVIQSCHDNDSITAFVLGLVESDMLRPAKERASANIICEKFEQFVMKLDWPVSRPQSPCRADSAPESLPSTSMTNSSEATTKSSYWSQESPPSAVDGMSSDVNVLQADVKEKPSRPHLVPNLPPLITVSPQRQETIPLVDPKKPPVPQDDSKLSAEPLLSSHTDDSRPSSDHAAGPSSFQNDAGGTSGGTSPMAEIADRTTVEHVLAFREANKKGTPADPETRQLVDYLEHNLGGRDQIFFIDDSTSMGEHLDTMKKGFLALSCIAKRLDPDKVELSFASRPCKVYKAKKTRRLYDLVSKHDYHGHSGLMESNFGSLVDSVIIPLLPWKLFGINVHPMARKQVSVYVFTDGNWGTDNKGAAFGVQRPVKRLMDEVKRRKLARNQVSLHFVRFGTHENGRQYLDHLDKFGQKEDWDIVDVKHITSNVAGMLLGPLDPGNDLREEETGVAPIVPVSKV